MVTPESEAEAEAKAEVGSSSIWLPTSLVISHDSSCFFFPALELETETPIKFN